MLRLKLLKYLLMKIFNFFIYGKITIVGIIIIDTLNILSYLSANNFFFINIKIIGLNKIADIRKQARALM
jgi:hypothetical protein